MWLDVCAYASVRACEQAGGEGETLSEYLSLDSRVQVVENRGPTIAIVQPIWE